MPKIEFTISEDDGSYTVDINGITGPACEDVERMIRQAAGDATKSEKKPSYYERATVRQQKQVNGRH